MLGKLHRIVVFGCVVVAISFNSIPAVANAVLRWHDVALQGAKDAKLEAPFSARALAIVHTCMFDAWAAYDDKAVGTQLGGALRRPAGERTETNKQQAVSHAAYRALMDLFPADTDSLFKPLMLQLGYDPNDSSTDIETPTGIGNVACAAVLEFRHHDQSNQLGDTPLIDTARTRALVAGPYSDWSGYAPINPPTAIPLHFPFVKPLNPNHWQPLTYTDSTGSLIVQMFSGAQWPYVVPFALAAGNEFRSAIQFGPAEFGSPEYQQQAATILSVSANLTDGEKMLAEYWSEGPDSDQPVLRWMRFAQFVSKRDRHSLDDDVKMFFALSNALFDASIAIWDAKRSYDSVRPITAIALLYQGKNVRAWGGPGKGTIEVDGANWRPYQRSTYPSPPGPEYVSETSTFSVDAAEILKAWAGSDHFGYSVTLPAGSSKIEPGHTPAAPITFKWDTFTQAADDACWSGRYGGIQFERGVLAGRKLGGLLAERAWAKAQSHFDGAAPPSFSHSSQARN